MSQGRAVAVMGLLVGVCASMGASYRTTNFIVEAPNPQVAQQIAQYAEFYRKQKAVEWLGRPMPNWLRPLPIQVTVTVGGAGGATSFQFDGGQIWDQQMHIEGSLDRLLASVLPHEITHTVFAFQFRCPLPRWADEGGSVLSEDDAERQRHDELTRKLLRNGRAMPLHRLFNLRDYPSHPEEIMALYAQGFSVTDFLVSRSNRQVFLAFVDKGMRSGWNHAVQTYYHLRDINDLERAWLQHMRQPRVPRNQIALNNGPAPASPVSRVVVRQTAPPPLPLLGTPQVIYRSQAPDTETDDPFNPKDPLPQNYRPAYLPDSRINQAAASPGRSVPSTSWQPAPVQSKGEPGRVRLGVPQLDPPSPTGLNRPVSPAFSPVGYPH